MLTPESITALQQAEATSQVFGAIVQAKDSAHSLAALPDNFKVHDLEKFVPVRRRARGTMQTPYVKPYAAYTSMHAEGGACIFVDPEEMQSVSVLNLGTPEAPGHADNLAVLKPIETAAYTALKAVTGIQASQQRIAEFLEDWAPLIDCHNDDGEIASKHAIAAIRKLTIESSRRAESEVQSLSATQSTLESVKATSTDRIPTFINFTTRAYPDLSPRTFAMRLSISTANDKAPMLTLRIIKEAEHDEAMAEELAGLVRSALDGKDIPVLIGSYTAKQGA